MRRFLIIVWIALLVFSCNEDPMSQGGGGGGNNNGKIINGWTVPLEHVDDAGGKDIVPSIENSELIPASQVDFLTDEEIVIGIKVGDDIRAYSHRILDLHEVSNEIINGEPITVNLCPLTGTSMAWSRVIDGQVTTFGVSGLLYNSNLIMYDRLTNSNWAQMLAESVNGVQVCNAVTTYPVVEASWATWKSMFPETLVQSTNTGFDRDYSDPPFSSIVPRDSGPLFPVNPVDTRLPNHERVHGIITESAVKVYRFESFEDGTTLISDFVGGQELVIVGNATKNFIVSFVNPASQGIDLEFTPVEDNQEVILEDNEGNQWNIFGEAVSGPRTGESLTITRSYMGYWFAWGAIFPNPDIYIEETEG